MNKGNKMKTWKHAANEWADAATNGLQWLKNIRDGISTPEEAIAALKSDIAHAQSEQPGIGGVTSSEALAQPQQEPVGAWVGDCIEWTENPYKFKRGQKIYTTPPASTATSEDVRLARKPLTDEEILSLWSPESLRPVLGKNKVLEFARAIEADHGLKETP